MAPRLAPQAQRIAKAVAERFERSSSNPSQSTLSTTPEELQRQAQDAKFMYVPLRCDGEARCWKDRCAGNLPQLTEDGELCGIWSQCLAWAVYFDLTYNPDPLAAPGVVSAMAFACRVNEELQVEYVQEAADKLVGECNQSQKDGRPLPVIGVRAPVTCDSFDFKSAEPTPMQVWEACATLSHCSGKRLTKPALWEHPESEPNMAEIHGAFRLRGRIPLTEHRALTPKQLASILEFATRNCEHWFDTAPPERSKTAGETLTLDILNLYHLNDWLIKPATKQHNCAFLELLSAEPQPPKWFVSHWWGELIKEFVLSIITHNSNRGLPFDTPYWVCAYANAQHSLSQDLTPDPKDTSFFKAMNIADGLLTILNDESDVAHPAVAFSRIWCCFELSMAVCGQSHQPGLMMDMAVVRANKAFVWTDGPAAIDVFLDWQEDENETCTLLRVARNEQEREGLFPIEVLKAGLSVHLEHGEAAQPADRRHILNSLAGRDLDLEPLAEHPRYDEANKKLRGIFASSAWRQLLQRGLVQEWGLPEVLAADVGHEVLDLDFTGFELGLDAFESLAKGMPPSLKTLRLHFVDATCDCFDEGITLLSNVLPNSLRELRLTITNTKFGNDGLWALAGNLPRKLRELHLTLCDTQVGDAGVSAVSRRVPSTLQTLEWHLMDTDVTLAGIRSIASNFPPVLKNLALYLDNQDGDKTTPQVGRSAYKLLGRSLPEGVESVTVCGSEGDFTKNTLVSWATSRRVRWAQWMGSSGA